MKIEYVTLYVNNLEFIKEFFIKYFDANIEKTLNIALDAKAYILSFDEGCMLEIMTHPHRQDTEKFFRRTGFNRLVMHVGSPKKLWDISDQLQADGYDLISSPHDTYNGYYGCCVIDSENNLIELVT